MNHLPKIITVSGSCSGAGKTTVAEFLLKKLKGWSALKVTVRYNGLCPTNRDCGVCEKLDSKFSIVADKNIIEEEGKDTQRLKKAGAKQVLWLRAKPNGLRPGLKQALFKMKGTKGVIIEGTSVLKYLKPDLAIFVGKKDSPFKSSAREVFKKVDLIITN